MNKENNDLILEVIEGSGNDRGIGDIPIIIGPRQDTGH